MSEQNIPAHRQRQVIEEAFPNMYHTATKMKYYRKHLTLHWPRWCSDHIDLVLEYLENTIDVNDWVRILMFPQRRFKIVALPRIYLTAFEQARSNSFIFTRIHTNSFAKRMIQIVDKKTGVKRQIFEKDLDYQIQYDWSASETYYVSPDYILELEDSDTALAMNRQTGRLY